MNYSNIIRQLAETDPEFFERTSERRNVIKNWTRKFTLTTLPLALGSLLNKAYGQTSTNADIVTVLNFALTLEHLEAEFYKTFTTTYSSIIDAADLPGFQRIAQDENQHVADLTATITSLQGTPVGVNPHGYDYTGGGNYSDVTTNYSTFKAVAQAFEDTGVRAYKGQATKLMSNNDVLTAALNIHSVEARHASYIRNLRGVSPWIKGNATNVPGTDLVYAGEEATTQTIGTTTINAQTVGGNGFSTDDASAAFDEPLTMQQVLAIVSPAFIIP